LVVAVENDLVELKNSLKERGYDVVDPENYNYPIDAIIYGGNAFQISHISRNNMPESSMSSRGSYGVFMINSTGKSIEEIVDMLNHRYYSPLF